MRGSGNSDGRTLLPRPTSRVTGGDPSRRSKLTTTGSPPTRDALKRVSPAKGTW